MDDNKSQEENLDGINFLFCEPYNESYYSYSINSIENKHLITRLDLNKLLSKLSTDKETIFYLTSHFRKFLFIKKENNFKELVPNYSIENEKKIIQETLEKELLLPKKKEKSNTYDTLQNFTKKLQTFFTSKIKM